MESRQAQAFPIIDDADVSANGADSNGTTDCNALSVKPAPKTLDVFKLLDPNLRNVEDAQRWYDIVLDLKQRIGDEKFKRESIRSKVIAIANLTLVLERDAQGVVEGGEGKLIRKSNYNRSGHPSVYVFREGNPERLIHVSAQINSLYKKLGADDTDALSRKADDEK